MRPTRRTQPFRKGLSSPGPVRAMMRAGKPAGMSNPIDVQRKLLKSRRRRRGRPIL